MPENTSSSALELGQLDVKVDAFDTDELEALIYDRCAQLIG